MACATGLPMAQYAADHIAASLNDRSMRPYDFRYGGRCISLGRRDGLIQMVRHDDSPKDQIITGRLAARIKEMICQYAFQNVNSERWLPGGALWARKETVSEPVRSAAS
jgi:NADH dehydrogenase FAD-containing subunit